MFKRQNITRQLAITVFIILLLSVRTSLYSQNIHSTDADSTAFFNLQREFIEQMKDQNEDGEEMEDEDGPNELFQRWSYWVIPRMYPNGKLPEPDATQKAWDLYKATHHVNISMEKTAAWQYAGPAAEPAGTLAGGGTGRINVLVAQPGSPKIMYAGTPDGGLWKTYDGGTNWTPLTDTMPNIGVADLAIDPKNTNTLYLATGDGYGYSITSGWFAGGTYSNGVMKSIDGGLTFQKTGLNWNRTLTHQIYHIAVNPANTSIIYASSDNGLWRSTDAGANWTTVINNYPMVDIKFDPANSSIVYASGSNGGGGGLFYYSTNSGKTWTSNNIPSVKDSRGVTVQYSVVLLGVTPADSNVIYALGIDYSNGYLFKSTDKGQSWSFVKQSGATYYGKYASFISVYPNDANHILTGGIEISESVDGGNFYYTVTTSTGVSNFAFDHADHRSLIFREGTIDTVYDGNDGGAYMGIRTGTASYTWKLISDQIHVLQLYGVASGVSNSAVFYTGAQDNGINKGDASAWNHVLGADGMLCAVRPDDENTVYANNQYGYLSKSSNGGKKWSYGIGPAGQSGAGYNNWIAPIEIDPNNYSTIYYGGNNLYRSTNSGGSWTDINVTNTDAHNVAKIAIAPSNSNYIYVVKRSDYSYNYASIYVTSDKGKTWTNISGNGLPAGLVYISDIKVDKKDSQKVWVSLSGFNLGQKVYMTTDAGQHWTNMSGSLPNVPVNCIAIENSVQNGVYAGTEIGVFYRTDSSADWVRYSDGLPNVIVNEIEVLPSIGKLRAATFGRGIWEGNIAGTISGIEKMQSIENDISIYPNPSNGIFTISFPNLVNYTPSISIYDVLGKKVFESEKYNNNSGEININLPHLSNGIYTISFNYKDVTAYKKILINHE